jgi:hypothetical protein
MPPKALHKRIQRGDNACVVPSVNEDVPPATVCLLPTSRAASAFLWLPPTLSFSY